MDEPGHRARKREAQQAAYYAHPLASHQNEGVETIEPLNERADEEELRRVHGESLPTHEERARVSIPEIDEEGRYQEFAYRPPVWVKPEVIPGPTHLNGLDQSTQSHAGPPVHLAPPHPSSSSQQPSPPLPAEGTPNRDGPVSSSYLSELNMTEVAGEGGGAGATDERGPIADVRPTMGSRHHSVLSGMKPHLQFMCGPMLVYHTVKDGVWHGAAMIVTADAGSVMNPPPFMNLSWSNDSPIHPSLSRSSRSTVQGLESRFSNLSTNGNGTSHLQVPSSAEQPNGNESGGNYKKNKVEGEQIYIYRGPQGSFTFTRFKIEIPLPSVESRVDYSINNGHSLNFWVPAVGQNLRWSTHSCNGFSGGVDTTEFFDPEKFANGYDPLWEDMLAKHQEKPFHCMVGGGDQIYCDSLMFEPEMQPWVNAKTPAEKIASPLPDTVLFAIDRYYFSHYCKIFRSGAFGLANASIPMVNMLDDHDLIDGFGSYPDELQQAPVFQAIGSRGYFWYLLFQLFTVDAVDGTDYNKPHFMKSMIIGSDGAWVPYPNHSLIVYFGPEVAMVLLDCRADRKKDVVCSKLTYERVFKAIRDLPSSITQLVLQLGIPIAYPRMNFAEKILDSPATTLIHKAGLVPGFVNKFNADAELLDDLSDHWTATDHKAERNWLIQEMQALAIERHFRVSFLSGDVHCAAVSCFKTMPEHFKHIRSGKADPEADPKYMLQVVTSAIVNTPPPALVSVAVSKLGGRRHKTLHHARTDEELLPIFAIDTDGSKARSHSVMGKRNWAQVDYLPDGNLRFDIRVEIVQGGGDTKSYPVLSPPPLWE